MADNTCQCVKFNSMISLVIIVILVVIFFKINTVAEHGIGVYTSGATQRDIGQVFSSTDQGSDGINYDPILLNILEGN